MHMAACLYIFLSVYDADLVSWGNPSGFRFRQSFCYSRCRTTRSLIETVPLSLSIFYSCRALSLDNSRQSNLGNPVDRQSRLFLFHCSFAILGNSSSFHKIIYPETLLSTPRVICINHFKMAGLLRMDCARQ
jgi:hypothetical protein